MAQILKRVFEEDRRLVFLKLLAEEPDYASNIFVIKDALAMMGHGVSFDRIRADAGWLEEQGLLTITSPSTDMSVYKITSRGKDVAEGSAVVPGVKKPEPGLDY